MNCKWRGLDFVISRPWEEPLRLEGRSSEHREDASSFEEIKAGRTRLLALVRKRGSRGSGGDVQRPHYYAVYYRVHDGWIIDFY